MLKQQIWRISMAIEYYFGNRKHFLSEAVIAQNLALRYTKYGMGKESRDTYFEGLVPVKSDNKFDQGIGWINNYKNTIFTIVFSAIVASSAPFIISLLLYGMPVVPLSMILYPSAVAAYFGSVFVSYVFGWAANRSVASDSVIDRYITENYSQQMSSKDLAIKVQSLLDKGGVLGRLINYFRYEKEISAPAISFLVAGGITMGIASLSMLGILIHLPSLISLCLGVVSGLCFISGAILWPRESTRIDINHCNVNQESSSATLMPVLVDRQPLRFANDSVFDEVRDSVYRN